MAEVYYQAPDIAYANNGRRAVGSGWGALMACYHCGGTYRLLTHERETYRVHSADVRAQMERERAYWRAQVANAEASLEGGRAKLAEAERALAKVDHA